MYKIWMSCSSDSNSEGEIFALWMLLFFTHLQLDGIRIFEDAKVIIAWALNANNINILYLSAWMKNTRLLIRNFKDISFSHVFRELNQLADSLPKRALYVEEGYIFSEKWVDGVDIVDKIHIYHS